MKDPRAEAEALEKGAVIPEGTWERFAGYGVMGVTFNTGNVLCLRRFPAASIGPGYTSIWHRDPDGVWTFIQDQEPRQACPRYFGSAVTRQMTRKIVLEWNSQRELVIRVDGDYSVHWHVKLEDNAAIRLVNTLTGILPDALWRSESALKFIGNAGSKLLGTGRMTLTGRVPNGQRIMAGPMSVWPVTASSAMVRGLDMGRPAPLAVQANLGDVWIPQKGRFFAGKVVLETFDPARHSSVTSKEG